MSARSYRLVIELAFISLVHAPCHCRPAPLVLDIVRRVQPQRPAQRGPHGKQPRRERRHLVRLVAVHTPGELGGHKVLHRVEAGEDGHGEDPERERAALRGRVGQVWGMKKSRQMSSAPGDKDSRRTYSST